MRKRTLLLWLLFARLFFAGTPSASAQDQGADAVLDAVVKITATRGETVVRGSGFVVQQEGEYAVVLTAAHVIEGADFEVTFPPSVRAYEPERILGMEGGNPHGLAAFVVRRVPDRVTALSLDVERRPRPAEDLLLAGFPQRSSTALIKKRVLAGRQGSLLQIDQAVGEGFSGGPVVRGGKVVGVVTSQDLQLTYAVNAFVAQEALLGWPVSFDVPPPVSVSQPVSPPASPPPSPPVCRTGEVVEDRGIAFVRICGGTFTMGSADDDPQADDDEKPAHRVTLSEYWIGQTEVTYAQYRLFRPDYEGKANHPVSNVSWFEAQDFCESLGFQLPTEAQWEYAARAGKQTPWSFGDDESVLGEYAWYLENSGGGTHPVGQKKKNPWGLYDMHGNVWEWVADWYGPYSAEAKSDPTGPQEGKSRLLRGGSFAIRPWFLRSAFRIRFEPGIRLGNGGFRCVRVSGRQP